MTINRILEKEQISSSEGRGASRNYNVETECSRDYAIFAEQYLEKPVISGDKKMALTPTACTIGGVPVIDDF